MDFADLTAKLAQIREKLVATVEQINTEAGGEPFYARFFLVEDKRVVGLISDLRMNDYKIVFNLVNEKLIGGKIDREISKKMIKLEEVLRIEVFKTASGKPMFISQKQK